MNRKSDNMKITINKIENKKDYIDEYSYVARRYFRIFKKPHSHIAKQTSSLLTWSIFIVFYLIMVTILAIKEKDFVYYVCIGVAAMCLLIYVVKLINTYRYLNANKSDEADSELEITKDKVVLNNKKLKQETTLDWEDVKKILVTKRCIIFMSEFDRNSPKAIIVVPRVVEEKVVKALEENKKKDLLIYNK